MNRPSGILRRKIQAWPLKIKLALLSFLVLALGIASLSWLVVKGLRSDFETLITAEQESSVSFVARTMDSELSLRIDVMQALAERLAPRLRSDDAKENSKLLQDRIAAQKLFSRDLYLLSREGIRIGEAPDHGTLGGSYASSDYFREAVALKHTVIKPQIGRYAQQPVLIVATPILNRDGSVFAVLCGSELIGPGSPFYFSNTIRNGRTGGFHVVSLQDGVFVTSTDPARVMTNVPQPGQSRIFDQRNAGDMGTLIGRDAKGFEVVSTAVHLATVNWYIAAYLPVDEAFAPMRGVSNRIYSGAVLIAFISGLLMWMFLRGELQALESTVEQLISSEGVAADDKGLLTESGSPEIRALITNINQLRVQVNQANAQLRRERDELEDTVKRRTEELRQLNVDLENRAREIEDLYNHAPCGYHSLDPDGRILRINDTELAWLGYTRKEFENGKWRMPDILTPASREVFAKEFPRFLHSGFLSELELELRCKDGSEMPVLVSAILTRDSAGRVVTTRTTVFNNTEHQKLVVALRESERRLSMILENAPIGMAIHDNDRRLLMVNNALCDMLGYTREALLSHQIDDFLHAEDRADSILAMQALLEQERNSHQVERRFLHKDGSIRWMQLSASAEPDEEGKVRRFIVQYEDVTERKIHLKQIEELNQELEQRVVEAEQAGRAKSVFLANMSHEIRTPMNAIIGFAHLAERNTHDDKQRQLLKKIHDASQHLLQIINDILDISKIEAGKLSLEISDVVLEPLFQEVCSLVQLPAQEKGLELIVDLAPGLYRLLRGDPMRLRQALLNYMSNAVKFTPSGSIVLAARIVDETADDLLVRFEVRDSGIGVAEENIGRLFKAFEQVDSSTTRKYGGTGLGLAINQRLAQMMRGEVGVEQKPEGGSVFWMTARLGKIHFSSLDSPGRLLRDGTLLVVDDLIDAARAHADILQGLGMQTALAASGREALRMIETADANGAAYDLILVDFRMPEMDGLEFAQQLKSLPLKKLPILVLVTAYDTQDVRGEAQQAGFSAVLSKPLSFSSLHDCVASLLAPRQSQWKKMKPAPADALPAELRGVQILLAEDNASNQEAICAILHELGVLVDIANNGEEAVAMAAAKPYALVLMDMQMPVMDGLSATRLIRALPDRAEVPIIAVSANAFAEDRQNCLAAGMNDHIGKPVEPDDLLRKLLEWLLPIGKPPGSAPQAVASTAATESGSESAEAEAEDAFEWRELEAMLLKGEYAARHYVDRYWPHIQARLGDEAGAFRHCLDRFDFESALGLLSQRQ